MCTLQRLQPDLLGLSGALTIYEVAQAHVELRTVLAEVSGDLDLDLRDLAELDSAGAQLLLACSRELAARGATLRVRAAHPACCELLELLRLSALYPMASAAEESAHAG